MDATAIDATAIDAMDIEPSLYYNFPQFIPVNMDVDPYIVDPYIQSVVKMEIEFPSTKLIRSTSSPN